MGGIKVNGPDAPNIESPEEMAGRFQAERIGLLPEWKERLSVDPSQLEELEREIHRAHARGADLLVAGLVAMVIRGDDFQEAAKQTRRQYRFPLSRG